MEKRLASLLNVAHDAIIATDAAQRIIIFNKGAERIFGYSAEEITGRPLEILMPASIGVTLCPFDGKTVKELMVDADRTMYVAKASGKNRFEFYTAEFAHTDSQGLYSHQLG